MATAAKAAAEAAEEATPTKKVASGKVVKYIGTADVREINEKSWRDVGVEDQGLVRWDKGNRWSVPVADLTKDAVAYCEKDDATFVVADAEV